MNHGWTKERPTTDGFYWVQVQGPPGRSRLAAAIKCRIPARVPPEMVDRQRRMAPMLMRIRIDAGIPSLIDRHGQVVSIDDLEKHVILRWWDVAATLTDKERARFEER